MLRTSVSLSKNGVCGTNDGALGGSKSHVAPVFQMSQPADVGGWRHNRCANTPRFQQRSTAKLFRKVRVALRVRPRCPKTSVPKSRRAAGTNQQSGVCLECAGTVGSWAANARVEVRRHCFFRRQVRCVLLAKSWLRSACRTDWLAGAAAIEGPATAAHGLQGCSEKQL